MAEREVVRAVIIGEDRASDAFSRVGRSVDGMAGKMDSATAKAAGLDRALDRQAERLRRQGVSFDALGDKAQRAFERITLAADKMRAEFPELKVKIETAEAKAKLDLFQRDVRKKMDEISGELDISGRGIFRRAGAKIGGLPVFSQLGSAGQAIAAGGAGLSNPYVAGTGIAALLAAAPFAGQIAAGTGIFGLGAGLAGLGIYGAASASTANDRLQLTAAADRLKAAQLRLAALQGGTPASPAQLLTAQAAVASAQNTLDKLRSGGNATALQLTAAQDRLKAAQDRLAALQGGTRGSPASILSAQAAVASSQATYSKLSNNYQQATAGQRQMQAAFSNLSNDFQGSLATIGAPFVPVLTSIAGTADKLLAKMTPVFAGAEKVIAGPFKAFGDTLIKAFGSPQVKTSIDAVAGAFGKILTALTPGLPGDVNEIATGITKVAQAVAANPQAFATFINDLFKLAQVSLSVIADLAKTATWIERNFRPALHEVAVIFDGVRHEVAHVADDMASALIRTWDGMFAHSIGDWIRFGHSVEAWWADFRHRTAVVFDGFRHEFSVIWDAIGNDTIGKVVQFLGVVVNWFKGLPGRITGALGTAEVVLDGWGRGVINGLLKGAEFVWTSVVNFFKSLPGTILHVLGIHSPPQWAIDAGKHIMGGIGIGLDKAKGAVTRVLGSITGIAGSGNPANALGGLGGGFGNEKAYALSQLSRYGWSPIMMNYLIPLWNRESGWNPFAVNASSGAYGIPQALPAAQGHPYNLGDWVSQINWGLRYIFGRYGSPLNAWQHEMAVGWYDQGGYLPPGLSLAYNGTGRPEPVGAAAAGATYVINVHPTPLARPADIGREVVGAIKAFERGSGASWRRGTVNVAGTAYNVQGTP